MIKRAFQKPQITVTETGSDHVNEQLMLHRLGDFHLFYRQRLADFSHHSSSHGTDTIPNIEES